MAKLIKKLLKTQFVLLCDYAYLTGDGKLSLVGKFETLFVSEFPINYPQMFLVANFEGKSNSNHKLKLKIFDGLGQEIKSPSDLQIELPLSNMGFGNLIHRMIGMPITGPGQYKIELYEDAKRIAETSFSVIRAKGKTSDDRGTAR